MHELAITQAVVAAVVERAGEAQVTRVVLEIGKLSGVVPESVRFCFDLCVCGTVAEGAELVILEPAGAARCRRCHAALAPDQPYTMCSCGSADVQWLAGHELLIKEMEIIPCVPRADALTTAGPHSPTSKPA